MADPLQLRRKRRMDAAEGYLLLDMPDHALRELDAVDRTDEYSFEWNQLRGEALRQKQEYAEALEFLQRAHAERPEELDVLLAMAWCYKRIDQLHKAIAALEKAYQFAADRAIVLYNLACYYCLAGDKERSLSLLGRALRLDGHYRKLIPGEPDFDLLRNDPDFQFVAGLTREAEPS